MRFNREHYEENAPGGIAAFLAQRCPCLHDEDQDGEVPHHCQCKYVQCTMFKDVDLGSVACPCRSGETWKQCPCWIKREGDLGGRRYHWRLRVFLFRCPCGSGRSGESCCLLKIACACRSGKQFMSCCAGERPCPCRSGDTTSSCGCVWLLPDETSALQWLGIDPDRLADLLDQENYA